MPRKMSFVVLLVLVWAAVFVASYFMSAQIEGPGNIDTGFKRLDMLARYQFIAFAVAVASAVLGIIWRRQGKRIMLVGLIPLLVSALLIVGIVVATMIFNPRLTPDEAYQPPKQTAPAVE